MKHQVIALAVFGCCSALAQAPPQGQVPASRAAAQGDAGRLPIQGSASSEPTAPERQAVGLESTSTMGAGPATSVMGSRAGGDDAAAAGMPLPARIDRNSSESGGPN